MSLAVRIGSFEGSRDVRLDLYDVSGRLVKRLVRESLDGGAYVRAWDRTSEGGTRVRPGVY